MKIKCLLFKHRLYVVQSFGNVDRVKCLNCEKDIALHHGMRIALDWDRELEELYKSTGHVILQPKFIGKCYLKA